MAVRGPNETDRGVRGVFLVQIGGVALRDNELGAPFPDGAMGAFGVTDPVLDGLARSHPADGVFVPANRLLAEAVDEVDHPGDESDVLVVWG